MGNNAYAYDRHNRNRAGGGDSAFEWENILIPGAASHSLYSTTTCGLGHQFHF